MISYEHKLASGKTLEELTESMNCIANIRNDEIDYAIKKGFDVMVHDDEWFVPIGELSYKNGEWRQVMRRRI